MQREVRMDSSRSKEPACCPNCGRQLTISRFRCRCCPWRWRLPAPVQMALLATAAIASIAAMLFCNYTQ